MPDAMEVDPHSKLGEIISEADKETTPVRREAASNEAPPEEHAEKVSSIKHFGKFNKAFTLKPGPGRQGQSRYVLCLAQATADSLSLAHCYLVFGSIGFEASLPTEHASSRLTAGSSVLG